MSERFTERVGRPPSNTSPPTPREVEDEIAERRPISHRSRAIRDPLVPHLYRRPANHWKTPRRFDRREPEHEEYQPLQKTGTPRSLKDIIKAKPRRRAPWK